MLIAGQSTEARRRLRLVIEGIVQGVGFRPFTYSLATRLGLSGFVANDRRGLIVEIQGEKANLTRFLDTLRASPPPLAVIERIACETVAPRSGQGFEILASETNGSGNAAIAPDVGTCADCLGEIFDPTDRRFGYAFTNCTNCGPRFTIVRGVPYDRSLTTMAGFAMCADCAREYHDPHDRRFHAEPISCPACGPRLRLLDRAGAIEPGEPIARTAALLRAGAIVALKGLGGFHLAVLAADESAVARLRARKHREDKPFALMVADLSAACQLVEANPVEERALSSPRRPVVLLARKGNAAVASAVAPGNHSLGIMLPYTPLHHLLAAALHEPFVLTSGNVSNEPIVYRDGDALERLGGIADHFLTHDRPIQTRADDSVIRVFRDREMPLRRSRGHAPEPLALSWPARRPILACGAELKSTFCLVKDARAFLSHHIGDLENFETLRSFTEGIELYRELFDVAPTVLAHDLHPEYLSTKWALEQRGVERIAIQHHHAHVAACLADNGEDDPVIGVAFDGLGYGLDGTLWGGEFLIADLRGFERVGHLEPVPLPGGVQAIREPWRMAAAYLDAAGEPIPEDLEVQRRNRVRWPLILRLARGGIQSPLTSSAGRLFDAVASVLGIRDAIHYEGQAAIELEQCADPSEGEAYAAGFQDGEPVRVRAADLVAAVVEDLRAGTPRHIIAARFHDGVARMIEEVSAALAFRRRLATVALSGGVFQNVRLLRATVRRLEARGFRVLTHRRVPCNDGGISFGQAAIAAARDRMVTGREGRNSRNSEGGFAWAH